MTDTELDPAVAPLAALVGRPVRYQTVRRSRSMLLTDDGYPIDSDVAIIVEGMADGYRIVYGDPYSPALREIAICGHGWVPYDHVQPIQPPWHQRLRNRLRGTP